MAKKVWKNPTLEILDINMTQGGNGNSGTPGNACNTPAQEHNPHCIVNPS